MIRSGKDFGCKYWIYQETLKEIIHNLIIYLDVTTIKNTISYTLFI